MYAGPGQWDANAVLLLKEEQACGAPGANAQTPFDGFDTVGWVDRLGVRRGTQRWAGLRDRANYSTSLARWTTIVRGARRACHDSHVEHVHVLGQALVGSATEASCKALCDSRNDCTANSCNPRYLNSVVT